MKHEKASHRFQPDEYGFDELVVDGVKTIHIERMDRGVIWMKIYRHDGTTHTVNFYTKGTSAIHGRHEMDA